MICPICQNETVDNTSVCSRCGSVIPRCPTCRRVIPRRMTFCTKDGTRLPDKVLALFDFAAAPQDGNSAAQSEQTVSQDDGSASQTERTAVPSPYAKPGIPRLVLFAALAVVCLAVGLLAGGLGKSKDEAAPEANTAQVMSARTPSAAAGAPAVDTVPADTAPATELPSTPEVDEAEWPKADNGRIAAVSATSTLSEPQYQVTHYAERMLDGDLSTAWSEGSDGQGIGESISVLFDGDCMVSGFTIWAGYHKSPQAFSRNSRPARIAVMLSDGSQREYELADAMEQQVIKFDQPVLTDSVKITIVDVYAGTDFEDTLISELSFF